MGRKRGSNKESKWASGGGGLQKHRKSGVAHNHAHTIQRNRNEQERLEREEKLRAANKQPSKSIKELFAGYN